MLGMERNYAIEHHSMRQSNIFIYIPSIKTNDKQFNNAWYANDDAEMERCQTKWLPVGTVELILTIERSHGVNIDSWSRRG